MLPPDLLSDASIQPRGAVVPKAPDERRIADLIAEGEDRYREAHRLWNHIDDLYYGRHALNIPELFRPFTQEIRSNKFRDDARRVVARLTIGRPVASMVPVDDGTRAQEKATKVEGWLNSMLQQWDRQFRDIVDLAVRFGVGYFHFEFLPNAWVEKNAAIAAWKERLSLAKLDEYELLSKERKRELDDLAKKLPLPFRLKVLDPRAVFVFPDEFGFKEALIGTEERRLEMADRYGGKLLRGKLGDGTPVGQTEKPPTGWGTVKKYVHYNRKYVTIYIDDEIVDQREHGFGDLGLMGRIPIVEVPGLVTSATEPEKRFESMLSAHVNLVPALDRALTQRDSWGNLTAYPSGVYEEGEAAGAVDLGDDEPAPLELQPGRWVRIPHGGKLAWVPAPDTGQALTGTIESLGRMLAEATPVPPVLKGESDDESGYQTYQKRIEARSFTQPAFGSFGEAYAQVCELALYAVEEIVEEPVFVTGLDPKDENKQLRTHLAVGPDDINSYRTVQVSITDDSPLQDLSQQQAGARFMKEGVISWYTALKNYFNESDPEAEIKRKILEDFMQSPQMKQRLLEEILAEENLKSQVEEAAANTGMPVVGPAGSPLGGPPPPPPGMPPGMPPGPPGMPPPMPGGPGPGAMPPDLAALMGGNPPLPPGMSGGLPPGPLPGVPSIPGAPPMPGPGGVPVPAGPI